MFVSPIYSFFLDQYQDFWYYWDGLAQIIMKRKKKHSKKCKLAMANPISRCWNKDNKLFKRLFVVTIDMICNMIYLVVFEKHSTLSKHICFMRISFQSILYWRNLNFYWYNKSWMFFLVVMFCSKLLGAHVI